MKTARLELRLEPEQKKLIEEAATLSGTTTSGFVQMVVLEKARAVIREHRAVERVTLPAAAFEQLLRDLDQPARAIPELVEQLEKTRS